MEISILLLTYNQEKYVRQAIDSIMMQKINVPYEIIAFDDASTDGTPEILREYKKRYPHKISLYLKKVNGNSPTKNGYFMLSRAQGKYFALIEGDDYWTDEFKIQKQYDFLEQHKEYSGCMTDLIVVDENNNESGVLVYKSKENSVYTLEDLKNLRTPGMTVTFLARNYFNKIEYRIIYQADRMMGDITTYMLCLLKGNIYQINEKMAAYRYICSSGKNNFNSINQENNYKNYMQVRYWIKIENYIRQYNKSFRFIPMPDIIKQLTSQFPAQIVYRLLIQSENRRKYLYMFFIYKFLLDSDYLLERKLIRKHYKKYRWSAFKKEKNPIILFGSGAVAVEYLNKYAWKDNILFLVDNEKKKQNTSFKGFLIKEPQEILKCRQKVNILITNKDHEADIEKQLQEMGISDYYCYCSMQTYRFRNVIADKLLKISEKW